MAKKAGLKLTSKAAKAAVADLRARIEAAIESEKARPDAALLDSRVLQRANMMANKREEEARKNRRNGQLDMIQKVMMDARVTKEEALEIWHKSVLVDVMHS